MFENLDLTNEILLLFRDYIFGKIDKMTLVKQVVK
jgi:hypothetical protein